jgi:hypothetical protein
MWGERMHPPLSASMSVNRANSQHKQALSAKQPNLAASHYTLGIVGAEPLSSELSIAYEMSTALADRQETGPHGERALRLMAMVGDAGRQNIADVVALPGVDLAIVPVLLLNRVRDSKELEDVATKLVYVTLLFPEEVHIIAGPDMRSIYELAGHDVNFGEVGSAGAVLGRDVFNRLGIRINEVNVPLTAAIDSMRKGHISATVLVSGKPVRSLANIGAVAGLHILALPYSAAFKQDYLPASFQHEDYPELIAGGVTIDTLRTNSVLIAYNWPPVSERYRLLESLVSTLFSRIRQLQSPLNHPKWRDVNLEATLPSWRRFHPAERWVEQHPVVSSELQSEFEQFLNQNGYGQ